MHIINLGKANIQIKDRAVTILTDILLPSNQSIYTLYGDTKLWNDSKYYRYVLSISTTAKHFYYRMYLLTHSLTAFYMTV